MTCEISAVQVWRNRARFSRLDLRPPGPDPFLEAQRQKSEEKPTVPEEYYYRYPAVARAHGIITVGQSGDNGHKPGEEIGEIIICQAETTLIKND